MQAWLGVPDVANKIPTAGWPLTVEGTRSLNGEITHLTHRASDLIQDERVYKDWCIGMWWNFSGRA